MQEDGRINFKDPKVSNKLNRMASKALRPETDADRRKQLAYIAKLDAEAKANKAKPNDRSNEGVVEGAKVDRMKNYIKKSEIDAGHGADDAENIAWATLNKRGYLNNKNKKKHPKEGWTHDSLADELFEHERTYEDKLQNMLNSKLKK
jgi:hypothetical protein